MTTWINQSSEPFLTSLPFLLFSPEPHGNQEWQHPVPQHGPSNTPSAPTLISCPSVPPFCLPLPLPPPGGPSHIPAVLHLVDTGVPTPLAPTPCFSTQPPHLCFCSRPCQDLEAEQLLGRLQSGSHEGRREALRHFVLLAPDMTFAQEVISRDGLQRLGTIIEDGDE